MHIYLSPDLKSGITFAILIFSGNSPVVKGYTVNINDRFCNVVNNFFDQVSS